MLIYFTRKEWTTKLVETLVLSFVLCCHPSSSSYPQLFKPGELLQAKSVYGDRDVLIDAPGLAPFSSFPTTGGCPPATLPAHSSGMWQYAAAWHY